MSQLMFTIIGTSDNILKNEKSEFRILTKEEVIKELIKSLPSDGYGYSIIKGVKK